MKKYIFSLGLALLSSYSYAEDLDLVVIYSDEVGRAYGGAQGTKARIDAMVDYTNQTFTNSGVSIKLKLKHTAEIAIPGDTQTTEATRDTVRTHSDVTRVRNVIKPDLTVYLTGGTLGHYSGVSYFPENPPNKAYGISIVHHTRIDTFAHEIGHNLGAGHGLALSDLNVLETHIGVPIRSAMGYGEVNVFRTMMSYNSFYQAPLVQYFSNPSIKKCGGSRACGTTAYNSAGGINQNLSFIKNYSTQWPSTAGHKIAEYGDPVIGNKYNGCKFTQTYGTGGGGYEYKEYTIACYTGTYKMGVEINYNPYSWGSSNATCKFHPKTSTISGSGSCSNWRVYLTN